MKTKSSHRYLSGTAVAMAVGLALAPFEAQAHSRSATVFGARGGIYHRGVNRSPGTLAASGSVTLPEGKTASSSLISQRTETGSATNAQATGFNGKTATYDSTSTKTATGFNRLVAATAPDGATVAKQVDVSHQDGAVVRTVTTTATPPKS